MKSELKSDADMCIETIYKPKWKCVEWLWQWKWYREQRRWIERKIHTHTHTNSRGNVNKCNAIELDEYSENFAPTNGAKFFSASQGFCSADEKPVDLIL